MSNQHDLAALNDEARLEQLPTFAYLVPIYYSDDPFIGQVHVVRCDTCHVLVNSGHHYNSPAIDDARRAAAGHDRERHAETATYATVVLS